MGKKRPHPDGESAGHSSGDETRKRPRTSRPHKPIPRNQEADKPSLSAIKKRARAIERLLARDNLNIPANKQNELERELAAHKQRIEDARAKKERNKMIKKYHMVRFFERKKATRFAKQLEKKLAQATDPDEIAQLKADLHVAQVDIDYARYFPFLEPYVSLYAGAASGEKDETGKAAQYLRGPRPPMWAVIEKTREEGQAALEKLQNRQPGKSADDARQPVESRKAVKALPAKKTKAAETKAKGPRQLRHEQSTKSRPSGTKGEARKTNGGADRSEESDDGGFFEED
ncbi:3813dcfe-cf73-4d13-8564-9e9d4aa4a947 [Thermothielavioides terrestris]|uniref:rRNA-processing protein EFG1 n=1 Tax=Thermothielavioides terrestris TaxID=2587410 RepID=A0A446BIN2_9PEZI|nr:3813dcfe-cf73-4d13-8564-9e9d4aa4a947 [Thermothielavioides terrestris]